MNPSAEPEVITQESRAPEKQHSKLIFLLLVTGTVFLIFVNLTYWLNHTILNTDEFTSKVSDVLQRPEASQRIGDVLAQQAIASGVVQQQLTDVLPARVAFLPSLLENELKQVISEVLVRVLALPETQQGVQVAIRQLHSRVVSTLEGRNDRVSVDNGKLVLDVSAAARDTFDQLGLPLPSRVQNADLGRIVLVDNAQALSQASFAVRSVKVALPVLLVAAVLVFGWRIYLTKDRAGGIVSVGYCIAIAGVLSVVAWRIAILTTNHYIGGHPVANMLVQSLTSNLRYQSLALLAFGLLIVVLAGGHAQRVYKDVARVGGGAIETVGAGKAIVAGVAAVLVLALIT